MNLSRCRQILLLVIAGFAVYRIFFDAGLPAIYPSPITILNVHDGDTVTVSGFGRCRLRGIDTPELWEFRNEKWQARDGLTDRDFAASDYLKQFLHREVIVKTYGKDRYDRWLIDLILPNGVDAASYIRSQNWEK